MSEKIEYAGFWPRLLAIIIDGVLFSPFFWVLNIFPLNHVSVIFLALALPCLHLSYEVLMLGFYGQTIGMMVVKIKVKKLNLQEIKWKESFLRYLVDCVLVLTAVAAKIYYFNSADESLFSVKDFGHFISAFKKANSNFDLFITLNVWTAWIWTFSEVVVLLLNEKKRAIHDFIAGTVVVKLSSK